jgi:hypothetical protein
VRREGEERGGELGVAPWDELIACRRVDERRGAGGGRRGF